MPSVSYFIFSVTIVFLVVFTMKLSRAKKESRASDEFWSRERAANETRKINPDTIEYLNIPLDTLPFQDTGDAELKELQDTVKALSGERLLNLTGMTNTDIKLAYGAANLPMVSQCDQRFTLLSRTLYRWAVYLTDHDESEKAKAVLECAVSCKSDISGIYTLLADIYIKEQTPEKVEELIRIAEELPTLMKASILQKLREKLTAAG